MAHHETDERYDAGEVVAKQDHAEARVFFTIVVGFFDDKEDTSSKGSKDAAYARAEVLDRISDVHAETPEFILRLMCETEPQTPNSPLINMVEQISFYLDAINRRGIFSGLIPEEFLAVFGSAEQFCMEIISETKLSTKQDFKDIDGFSWVMYDFDELAAPGGRLIISSANGSIGGR
ncbi:MAG: hypothetical protein AAGD96_18205 [Chloroflexota bacterium]